MLCLSLRAGDYLTIGEDVVLQLDRMTGERCKLVINAPREIPILRGDVRERSGVERPDCVMDKPRWHKREVTWDSSKTQALTAMRKLLSKMDGNDADVRSLRQKLDHIFPPVKENSEA